MKLVRNALAASVLLASAGNAMAANQILNGADPFFPGTDSDFFISIFRDDPVMPMSMIIDTDVSLFGVIDGSITSWTSNVVQTAAILSFLGTDDLSDFVFNAGGATTHEDIWNPSLNWQTGFFTTSRVVLTPTNMTITSTGMEGARQNTANFVRDINLDHTDTTVVANILPGESGFHDNLLWGDSINGMVYTGTEIDVGLHGAVYWVYNGSPDLFLYDLDFMVIGDLYIDPMTGQASFNSVFPPPPTVPVPAAAWLFASGLGAMVGIARRQKRA